MKHSLLSIESLRGRAGWGYPELQSFFISIRQIIEHTKTKDKYPTLSFYCDWVAHSAIDRAPTGYKMLERINHFLMNFPQDYDEQICNDLFNALIREVYSFEELSTEILAFSAEHGIEPFEWFTDERNFPIFRHMMISYLQEKPVSFPPLPITNRVAKASYEKILAEAKAKGLEHTMVVSFRAIMFDGWMGGGGGIELRLPSGMPLVLALTNGPTPPAPVEEGTA